MSYANKNKRHVRQGRRRNYNRQHQGARFRALIGAQLALGIPIKPPGLVDAAVMVGSTPAYVAAMKNLIQAGAWRLLDAVPDGQAPILVAGDVVKT
jgi:hypothetical protein